MSQTSQTQIVKRIKEITAACIRANGGCTTRECSQAHNRQYGFGIGEEYIKSVWEQLDNLEVTASQHYHIATEKDIKENTDDTTDSD